MVAVTKTVKLTPWQVFLKDFGSSHGWHYKLCNATLGFVTLPEGKEVMKQRTKQFSLAATHAYSCKPYEEKEELKRQCCKSSKTLTAKHVKQAGCKVFKTNMQVSEHFRFQVTYSPLQRRTPGFLHPLHIAPIYREPRFPAVPYV